MIRLLAMFVLIVPHQCWQSHDLTDHPQEACSTINAEGNLIIESHCQMRGQLIYLDRLDFKFTLKYLDDETHITYEMPFEVKIRGCDFKFKSCINKKIEIVNNDGTTAKFESPIQFHVAKDKIEFTHGEGKIGGKCKPTEYSSNGFTNLWLLFPTPFPGIAFSTDNSKNYFAHYVPGNLDIANQCVDKAKEYGIECVPKCYNNDEFFVAHHWGSALIVLAAALTILMLAFLGSSCLLLPYCLGCCRRKPKTVQIIEHDAKLERFQRRN